MTTIGLMTLSPSTMETSRLLVGTFNILVLIANHDHHDDQQVTILNESHFPDWNINEFRMMRGDTVSFIHHDDDGDHYEENEYKL